MLKKYGFRVYIIYIVEVKRFLGLATYAVPNAVEELTLSKPELQGSCG